MKKIIPFLLSLLLLQISCQNKQEQTDETQVDFTEIESRLIPPIQIEGEAEKFYTLEERMQHYKVPGVSIAIVDNGEIAWAKGYGYLSFDSTKQVDASTMFQAASISKPVAALAALKLVEEGKLSLTQHVNDFLTDWKLPGSEFTKDNPVTLEKLVTHTAGLTVHGFGGYAKGEAVPSTVEVLNGAPPANSAPIVADTFPGSIWRYSGGGYTVMQKMIADVTGQPFEQVMDELVLSKLNMSNSTYHQPLPEKYHTNASIGHRGDGERVAGDWHTYPEQAAAGLWTTPSDLAKYVIEVQMSYANMSNQVISQQMTRNMLTPRLGDWGLGPSVSVKSDTIIFSHGGANEGYRCQMVGIIPFNQGIVVMTNSDNGSALAGEILRGVSQLYGWDAFKPTVKKIMALDAAQLQKFVGIYQMGPEMTAEITLQDNVLMVKRNFDGVIHHIYPEAELSFFDKNDGAIFEFGADSTGVVDHFVALGQFRFEKIKE